MKFKVFTLLLILMAVVLFSGCNKEQELQNKASFNYTGRLAGAKMITMEIDVFFDSKTDMDTACLRKENLTHALDMTMPIYSYPQLKGSKLKILLRDILKQVFRDSVKSFDITSVKFS